MSCAIWQLATGLLQKDSKASFSALWNRLALLKHRSTYCMWKLGKDQLSAAGGGEEDAELEHDCASSTCAMPSCRVSGAGRAERQDSRTPTTRKPLTPPDLKITQPRNSKEVGNKTSRTETSRGICTCIRYVVWEHIFPTLEPHLLILVVQVDDLAHKAALSVLCAGRHPLLACGALITSACRRRCALPHSWFSKF